MSQPLCLRRSEFFCGQFGGGNFHILFVTKMGLVCQMRFKHQLRAISEISICHRPLTSCPRQPGGRRKLPLAFTEHGAIMAATVLSSSRAVEMSVYVVRAFVQLREVLATHKDLAVKLATLERQTQALALKHDTLAQNTRHQLKQVFEAIRELMVPPEPKRRSIGFVVPEEKKPK